MNRTIRIFTFMAALGAITCCTKYEQKEMQFSPLARKVTKTIMTSTEYTDAGFVVTAYYNTNTLYFQDAQVENVNGTWESTNFECYWPLSGSLDFTAYSPLSAKDKGFIATNGKISCSSYSITDAEDMGRDICYATARRNDCENDKTTLDIVFHHALSYINVRLNTTNDLSNGADDGMKNTVTINIDNVELQNILSTASFSYQTGSDITSHWSSKSNPLNYNITAPNSGDSVGFLMIPQTLREDAAIKVEYTITQKITNNGTEIRTITTSHEGVALIGDGGASWDENRKIVYDLNISDLHPMTFSAAYGQDWDSSSGNIYQF